MSEYYELDQFESDILQKFDSGKFQSTPDATAQKQLLQQYAKSTLNKTKNINIRLSE